MVRNVSKLPPTSSKKTVRWRHTSVTFIAIYASGAIVAAHQVAEKAAIIEALDPCDVLLIVRPVRYPPHPEVLVVDNLDEVRAAFDEPTSTEG